MKMQREMGRRILEIRQASDITQQLLADYLKIDQDTLSSIENGDRPPSLDSLSRLSDLFGCAIEYFTDESSNPASVPVIRRTEGMDRKDLEAIAALNKIDAKTKRAVG